MIPRHLAVSQAGRIGVTPSASGPIVTLVLAGGLAFGFLGGGGYPGGGRQAAAAEAVTMPGGAPLPTTLLYEEDRSGARSPVLAFLTYGALQAKSAPREDADSIGPPLAFLQTFRLAAYHQSGRTAYYLLVESADQERISRYIGWVDERFLLRSQSAIQDPRTRIYKKALLVNTKDSLKETVATPRGDELDDATRSLSTRDAPVPTGRLRRNVSLYEIFYVYGEFDPTEVGLSDDPFAAVPGPSRALPTDELASNDSSSGYVLIGTRQVFDELDAERDILGWVPRSRVTIWDTREALWWDVSSTQPDRGPARRLVPGAIFPTAKQALTVHKNPTSLVQNEAVFVESYDPQRGGTKEPPAEQPRFPLLPPRSDAASGAILPRGLALRQVGVVGGFRDELSGDIVLTEKQIRDAKQIIDDLRKKLRIEVVFAVDDTQSMDPWFARTAATVESMIERLASLDGRRANASDSLTKEFAVGVVFYNDLLYGEPRTATRPVEVLPLRSASDRAAIQDLITTVKTRRVHDGGDARERMFEGLQAATGQFTRDPLVQRLVILIGDVGDHWNPSDGPDAFDRVVKAFTGRPDVDGVTTPIHFLALHCAPIDGDPDRKAFREQCERIATQLNAAEEGAAQVGAIGSERDLADAVLTRQERLLAYHQDQLKALEAARQGDLTLVGPALLKRMELEGVPVQELSRKGAQLFEQGFVVVEAEESTTQSAGRDAFRREYLYSGADIQRMVTMLNGLVVPATSLDHTSPLDVLLTTVENQIGEGDPQAKTASLWDDRAASSKTISDLMMRKTGLQATSPLLNRSFDELRRISRERSGELRMARNDLEDLHKKRMILEDILAGREFEYVPNIRRIAGEAVTRYERGREIKPARPRYFHIGGDESSRWYWIREDEWP